MFIKIKVHPGAKREAVKELAFDKLEIFVKEKPEKGAVNNRLIEILSSLYQAKSYQIRLVKGAKKTSKIFEIRKG